ncbi:glucose dehydrogenase [Bradyrhizobium sp. LB9.1b]
MLVRGLTRSLSVVCASCALLSSASAQTDLASRMKDPGQWPMAARDYANTRYSELDQINATNASRLQLAWTFSVGADRGQEAAPLVVDGTMYVVGPYAGPYPNRVFALDATTGELKWSLRTEAGARCRGRCLLRCRQSRTRLRQWQGLPQHAR